MTFRESVSEDAQAVARVRDLMQRSHRERSGTPRPALPGDTAESAEGASTKEASPDPPAEQSGSLEALLAAVDAELSRHLRRLQEATDPLADVQMTRVGVFPNDVILESRFEDGATRRFALPWSIESGRLCFGNKLTDGDALTASLGSWSELAALQRESHEKTQEIAHLTERLRQTTAERDRLTERLTSTPVTSALRRHAVVDRVPDDVFVRTVRRR